MRNLFAAFVLYVLSISSGFAQAAPECLQKLGASNVQQCGQEIISLCQQMVEEAPEGAMNVSRVQAMCLFSMAQLWSTHFAAAQSVASLIDSVNRNLSAAVTNEDVKETAEPDLASVLDTACGSLEQFATPDDETDVTALLIEHSTCTIIEIGKFVKAAQ